MTFGGVNTHCRRVQPYMGPCLNVEFSGGQLKRMSRDDADLGLLDPCKIYVGGLPLHTTPEELTGLCNPYGQPILGLCCVLRECVLEVHACSRHCAEHG